ncbi:unnamed protein product [Linum tenue]|uniref:Transmembrane protein n=1 Tax=Linum tenue TaxID=586396 RepID=A0AAV0RTA0_9ROSI|nr:unnamed protein product [Linum tenue]
MEEKEKNRLLSSSLFSLSLFQNSFSRSNLLSSLVLHFVLQQSMKKLQPPTSNSVTLQILLLSSCSFLLFFSFLGLKIDDAPYCQRGDRSSHEFFYHGGSGW